MDYLKDKKKVATDIFPPVIWSLIIPLAFFDIWMEFYHRVCFPLCYVKCTKRFDYSRTDRRKLKYSDGTRRLVVWLC